MNAQRTPGDRIAAFVEKHGFTAGAVKPIPIGLFNESFYVRTTEGPDIVVRVAPPDDAGFVFYERGMMAQEPEIHSIVRRRTGIPIPRVFAYDDSRTVLDRDALIIERLPGRPLSTRRLDRRAVDRVLEAVGACLRTLHRTCTARQYGYLGAHAPMAPADSWIDAFSDMWDRLISDLEGCGVYRPEDGEMARAALRTHEAVFDYNEPAALLHMDVWAQNVLVDDEGSLCGILDWDRALWGDPEIEYAVLDYCGFDTEAFWRGYGGRPDRTGAANIRHRFYLLYELQKYPVIWTRRRGGRAGSVAEYRDYALRILRELDSGDNAIL